MLKVKACRGESGGLGGSKRAGISSSIEGIGMQDKGRESMA